MHKENGACTRGEILSRLSLSYTSIVTNANQWKWRQSDVFPRFLFSAGRAELKGTPSQKLSQLREVEAALLEERQKLRSTIVQLKQDRSHYRSVADDLRWEAGRVLPTLLAEVHGSGRASFWEDAYTVRKWTRHLRTKIQKCVPTK